MDNGIHVIVEDDIPRIAQHLVFICHHLLTLNVLLYISYLSHCKNRIKRTKEFVQNARGEKFKQYEQGSFKIKLFLISFIHVFGARNFPNIIYLLSRLKIDEK